MSLKMLKTRMAERLKIQNSPSDMEVVALEFHANRQSSHDEIVKVHVVAW